MCVTWARYKRIKGDDSLEDEINIRHSKQKQWERYPYLKILKIKAPLCISEDHTVYEGEDGRIFINVRTIPIDITTSHIIISLVNDLNSNDCKIDSISMHSIYQPSIRVNLKGDCKLVTRDLISKSAIEYLYKSSPVLARGHMCSAVWKGVDYSNNIDPVLIWPDVQVFKEASDFLKCDVRSEFIPIHPSPAPYFDWINEISDEKPEFSAQKISEIWNTEDIEKNLTPLVNAYERWINRNEASFKSGESESNAISAEIIKNQKRCLDRLKSGIELIKQKNDARLAFCFANKVLWIQNIWKKRQRIHNTSVDFSWRPFQLAFFLMVIESLYERKSEYRDVLDLLWIPTGGGKTEAYLAIMAFTIALRRRNSLCGKTGSQFDKSGAGVSIITRYTLRLLTVQQFRRTLLMIMAAEYLRVFEQDNKHGWRPLLCPDTDDWLYGTDRFSIGIWVGGGVSPNHLRGPHGALTALKSKVEDGDPAQIIKCPACGAWLSIPRAGLSEGENVLYHVIYSELNVQTILERLKRYPRPDFIKDLDIISSGLSSPFHVFKTSIISKSKISDEQFDEAFKALEETGGFVTYSFRPSRPGYFPCRSLPGKRTDNYSDFEIFCPSPDCDLNKIKSWSESTPSSNSEEGTVNSGPRPLDSPFHIGNMPIPAYTTDEQIYHRCPTVVISTVDKIARLAFEPRAGSMFGAVSRYNRYYGFLRGNAEEFLPNETLKGAFQAGNTLDVKPFQPPDLIIQDELHLMDGPLGSMFGLFESIVQGLILHAGGNPKYIASSATVTRAEEQVNRLFYRETSQFPPNGLHYRDSFFVRFEEIEKAWDENNPGKIYFGVYAPGMGPMTPNVRLWSRILKTGYDLKDDPNINNYWTLVGFFNSVRELAGNRSLYREDIVERLAHISGQTARPLDAEKIEELSSRANSTDIPQIIEDLEQGKVRIYSQNPDVIFTTSMFGTGVDIPHLSLMIVNGQPKTTSQYIQATGRVGRERGALVVTFFRAGRPRDLSHYELFMGYHNRINLYVEPASVAPISDGCLDHASGPAMIAFFRNMRNPKNNWAQNNGHSVRDPGARIDLEEFLKVCFGWQTGLSSDLTEYLKSQFEMWERTSQKIGLNTPLRFYEYTLYQKAKHHVVLGDPAHELKPGIITVFKNAPQSLRDIEETSGFEV